jgi:hypothetical protein
MSIPYNRIFSFEKLSPSTKLSVVSYMSSTALIDYALASPYFHTFLYDNIETIATSCLRIQYGFVPAIHRYSPTPPAISSDDVHLNHAAFRTNRLPNTLPELHP